MMIKMIMKNGDLLAIRPVFIRNKWAILPAPANFGAVLMLIFAMISAPLSFVLYILIAYYLKFDAQGAPMPPLLILFGYYVLAFRFCRSKDKPKP